jgi:hypothetical protein
MVQPSARSDLRWTLWSTANTQRHSYAVIISEIDSLLAHLSELGIQVNKSCRLNAARDIMVQLDRHELPPLARAAEDPVRIILATLRDVIQWTAIALHAKITDDPIYTEKARLLLKDAVDVSDRNELPTPGRAV